jgi:kynurenine formamidase
VTLPDLSHLRLFDLERPRTARDPIHPGHQPPGFSYVLHRHHEPGPERRTGAAGVLVTSEHAGTHIDALSHQAFDLQLHGGLPAADVQTQFGFRELGAEALDPILCHGVLIDLVRHTGAPVEPGRWLTLDEVQAAATAQGVEPAAGDVVLVRTGNGANWGDAERYLRGSGMAGPVSRWLAGLGVRAVGADNVAWDWTGEPDLELGVTLPGHVILLVESGIPILENLDLEELGEAGVREFLFCCLPLKLRGVTASPVRPVALAEA